MTDSGSTHLAPTAPEDRAALRLLLPFWGESKKNPTHNAEFPSPLNQKHLQFGSGGVLKGLQTHGGGHMASIGLQMAARGWFTPASESPQPPRSQLTLSKNSWRCYNVVQGATSYVQPNAHHPKPRRQRGLTTATSQGPSTCRAGWTHRKTVPPRMHENRELPLAPAAKAASFVDAPTVFVWNKSICKNRYLNTQQWKQVALKTAVWRWGLEGECSWGAALISMVNKWDSPQTNISSGCSFLSLDTNNSGRRNVYLFGFQSHSPGPFPAWETRCPPCAIPQASFLQTSKCHNPPSQTIPLLQPAHTHTAIYLKHTF